MRKYLGIFLLALLGGVVGSYLFQTLNEISQPQVEAINASDSFKLNKPVPELIKSTTTATDRIINLNEDFVDASSISTSSVVFIKNISERAVQMSFFDMFFGEPSRTSQTVSTGSGVIFSRDGYIVTNNHVVADATKIEVIHQKKTYTAMLVGTDPSTDIAVLKIDNDNLPQIPIGSSKNLQVGEWVLAVGNPFNLTSTVTAGIVSAKGRNINILRDKFPIESFIQTDAAINPGNSGGALVNKKGELVGINTAILSRTGSYAGYGFAVPIDIVKKVVKDIISYGEVQKAFFGGDVADLDAELAEKLDLNFDASDIKGVLISYLQSDGAAAKAGIKQGDILLKINQEEVNTKSTFDEIISYYSPGDKIKVTIERNGKHLEKEITLTNREGTTDIIRTEIFTSRTLGADLEVVPKVERDLLEIDHGVRIKNVYRNGLISELGIEKDFIVTSINNYPIKTPKDLNEILGNVRGRVRIEGVDRKGVKGYYSFYFR